MRKKLKCVDRTKYRNELKYICTDGELIQIKTRIKTFCRFDPHVGREGIYRIRSIYFDDEYNNCFYDNEDGINLREKFRIRIYNEDFSAIFLECKGKENSMTYKEDTPITKEICNDILKGKFSLINEKDRLLSKFYLQYRGKELRPKVVVSYERMPFIYPVGNVRITLDRNIGGSLKVDDFFNDYLPMRPVMPQGWHILEVKYDNFLPDFLYKIMNLRDLKQTAYSKYYYCRKFII